MAVNQSRDLKSEFNEGVVDSSFIKLAPNRGGVVEDVNAERLSWPTYRLAEQRMLGNKYPAIGQL